MKFQQAVAFILVTLAVNANAAIIITKAGNSYDVQVGGQPSPYLAWLADKTKTGSIPDNAMDLVELRYQSKIPHDQMGEIRAEASEVFEKYVEAAGDSFRDQFREAEKRKRFLNILIWVGAGQEKITVKAIKEGEVLEKRTIPHFYIAVFNPGGGGFTPMIYPQTSFWLRGETQTKPLLFLTDEKNWNPDAFSYLDEMLGVKGTNLWVSFSIVQMRKESVDLVMDVFDDESVVRTEYVRGSIRTNLCVQDSIASYSIQPNEHNDVITFHTETGSIQYDVKDGAFKPIADTTPVTHGCK